MLESPIGMVQRLIYFIIETFCETYFVLESPIGASDAVGVFCLQLGDFEPEILSREIQF